MNEILAALPPNFPAAVLIVFHRAAPTAERPDPVRVVLQAKSTLPIEMAAEGDRPLRGTVYVAPADMRLTISARKRFHLLDGRRIRNVELVRLVG